MSQALPPLTPEDEIRPAEFHELLQSDNKIVILDVRQPDEHAHSAFLDSKHIPLGELPDRCDELNPNDEIVVHCKMGGRSARAVAFLKSKDFANVRNLVGGLTAYAKDHDPSLTPK